MIKGLLMLLDDITAVLDDVSIMAKVATKKTAAVLGDDLALNAEQVAGVSTQRELPVVWAVAKGSFLNKLILVPAALLISIFIPWLIMPLLMIGGSYLCLEGAEKVVHKFFPTLFPHDEIPAEKKILDEKSKINGAIRTDFILSAEIVVIILGVVEEKTLLIQFLVLASLSIFITIFVYGLVAAIVKIDDLGFWLYKRSKKGSIQRHIGEKLILSMPYLMRTLTVVGTLAMFLVGGGLIIHEIPAITNFMAYGASLFNELKYIGTLLGTIFPNVISLIFGFLIGLILLTLIHNIQKLKRNLI